MKAFWAGLVVVLGMVWAGGAFAAPVVADITPTSGVVGTDLTLAGGGFFGVNSYEIGGASDGFSVTSDTEMHVTIPAPFIFSSGCNAIQLYFSDAPFVQDFGSVCTVPAVASLDVTSGSTAGGTDVTITGTGFVNGATVKFGSTPATNVTVVDNQTITATSPAGIAGTVDVVVTTSGGTSDTSSADHFTYVGAPNVTSISPTSGPATGGTLVTVNGASLDNATEVDFGGTPGTSLTHVSDSQITVLSPSGTANANVSVVAYSLTYGGSSSAHFLYLPVPAVSSISPTSGPGAGGTVVTITGSNLTGATGVKFGTADATEVTVVSSTSVTAKSPAGTGQVDVTVTTATGTSATVAGDKFLYKPAPSVSSISPTHGPPGTVVSISGNNLNGAQDVLFGTTSVANQFSVSSGTFMTAHAPAGTGTVHITVVSGGGTSDTSAADLFTYDAPPAPAVTGVSPASGPTAGGTSVTVAGTGFTDASAVSFGGSAATSYDVVSDTEISATSPSGTGTVDITVTTANGTSTTTAADQFTYVAAPTVTAINANTTSALGGGIHHLTGTGFTGATAVTFGTTPATTFTVLSDTQITATSPPGTAGSVVHVTVTTPGGTSATSSADQVQYGILVTSVSPGSGPKAGGTLVTITGSGFLNATQVIFGATTQAPSFDIVSDSEITATTPDSGGYDSVIVDVWGATLGDNSSAYFNYLPVPTVTAVAPGSGPVGGGTTVIITGTGFTDVSGVMFGATSATFTRDSDTQITATAPLGSAGTVDITVTTAGGTSATSSADQFTYIGVPFVNSVSPQSGPIAGGTVVTIGGSNFVDVSDITVGGTAVTAYTVDSATQITATMPPGSGPGPADLVVTTASGPSSVNSSSYFAYLYAPVVSGVSPSSGPEAGGTTVTVTGDHLSDLVSVTFGGVEGTDYAPVSDTEFTVKAPAGTGTVDVVVTTDQGTSVTSSADQFTYVAPPAVTGLSPAAGPEAGGTSVTVTGTGFTGASAVTFGSANAIAFDVVSDTEITATSPPGSGSADIRVTTGYGQSTISAADQFSYLAAPSVTGIAPASGPETGGTSVTITGTGLADATEVDFGSSSATFTVNGDTSITATSPVGSAGLLVHVTVTTPGGSSALVSADHFIYFAVAPAPVVSGVSPDTGPAAGGTPVTISGSHFIGATTVKFGTADATGVSIVDDNTITATSPAGSGTVDITVANVDATSATSADDQFTYVPAPAAPTVTGLSPASGPAAGGTSVTVTGTGFTGATGVTFGGLAASDVSISSDSVLTATAPAGTGTVDVQVVNGVGPSAVSGADQFTYTAATPPDSTNLGIVVNQFSLLEAQASGAAFSTTIAQALSVGLSDGSALDVGPGTLFLAYGPDLGPSADAAAAEGAGSRPGPSTGTTSLWVSATGTGLVEGLTPDNAAGWQVNLTGGLGYRVAPNVVVGILGGYERFAYDSTMPAGHVEGYGYTAGAYAGARTGSVMTDIAIAYSGVHYDATSGAATGSLDASRWLVSGGLTGLFDLAGFDVRPAARLYGLWEGQGEWTDSLGAAHDAHSFGTARLSLGGTLSRALPIGDGNQLVPYIGAYADEQASWDSAGPDTTGWSGRVTAGVEVDTSGGAHLAAGGEIGGLGSSTPTWSLRGTLGGSF